MARRKVEEVEALMDRAILEKEHLKSKKIRHGVCKRDECSIKLRLKGVEVEDER